MVCEWFGLKTTWTVFSGLASKSVVTVFSGLASKPVARVSGLGLKTDNYGLIIWTSKSPRWFLGLGLKIKRALVG
jgi:hypothetical protein